VWVALKQSAQVELKVYETREDGKVLGISLLEGKRATVALGRFLHVVAVTASSRTGVELESDRLYAYDLHFTTDSSSVTLEQALQSQDSSSQDSSSQDSFNPFEASNRSETISYFAHGKPTFALPPEQLTDLRIVHGSCRKPHGGGFDTLTLLDSLIQETAQQPRQRPHQLFLTGDQIYGDDVAEEMLAIATPLGNALLDWEESLPLTTFGDLPDQPRSLTLRELSPGQRIEIATEHAGFTAGFNNKEHKVTSHLLGLGEYYATYLLSWSPICWFNPLSQAQFPKINHADLQQFIHTLWKVQRALANIPLYCIFDDHDVTDDWNLNRAWCKQVLGRSLGRRSVQNALLAYAVFQAWGNDPRQFAEGQRGAKLLAAAQAWSQSKGTDFKADAAIAHHLGMPPLDRQTDLPKLVTDGTVQVLDRHPEALTWHYTLRSRCHEVIVLDTRTWRGYPLEGAIAPPRLLSPHAFAQQLEPPLQAQADSPDRATFVIAPTNMFGLQVIDWIQHWHLKRRKVFSVDVGDAWNLNMEALAQFLTTLFQRRNRVIILSGDIHYSAVTKITFTSIVPFNRRSQSSSELRSTLLQLTSSAIKNQEFITYLVHTRLKEWLLPESVRRWVGWNEPLTMTEIVKRQDRSKQFQSHPPDWSCTLNWGLRQATVPVRLETHWLLPPEKQARYAKWFWLGSLAFWKSRWFHDGREVVGVNNLAVVQFEGCDRVIQDLYWFSRGVSPKKPVQIVRSRFEEFFPP
jgi:hypothetical protein